MAKLIYKVQVPLATNEDEPMALVYTVAGGNKAFVPVTEELLEAMQGEPKAFFWAEVKNGVLHIDRPAPWQDW